MKQKKLLIVTCLFITGLLLTSCGGTKTQEGSQSNDITPTQAVSENEALPKVESGISAISKYGNIILDVTPETMRELGFEPADVIDVRIGRETIRMPIGAAYSDVDSGEPVCCIKANNEGTEQVVLAINNGNLASSIGLADIRKIDADPGYEVIWSDGFDASAVVYLSMAEKQGYAEEYQLQQLTGARSNNREDYPDLSDMEFANFREVNTTGMGRGALYRSSTPIDPALGRNGEADAQISASNIQTILNMTDQESMMKAYPGYEQTNYSKCNVIAIAMGMDYFSDEFRQNLADELRFMLDHEGPYLIHCKEGKDRTGFLAGILASLMGADMDEITGDYMKTYYNYYGITPESPQYAEIADSNIKKSLAKAFGLNQLEDAGSDLSAYASAYLKSLGMSEEEVFALKSRLSKDYTEVVLQ